MGSNPIPSIESSVQRIIAKNKDEKSKCIDKNRNDTKSLLNYSGCQFNNPKQVNSIVKRTLNRDIYNRPKKLEHWKDRAKNDLDSSDLVDVFKLIEHMEDTESSTLWIVRCITALILLRKH
jgi:16S rRNA A1518/A1519 N6-dimethyltransferase RsmA/KsgA/DIM1 with predicted DNA glycosylase/AP lyase activity